jgi:hypothetical protein
MRNPMKTLWLGLGLIAAVGPGAAVPALVRHDLQRPERQPAVGELHRHPAPSTRGKKNRSRFLPASAAKCRRRWTA